MQIKLGVCALLLLSCLLSSDNVLRVLRILYEMVAGKNIEKEQEEMKGHHILYINFRCDMEQNDENEASCTINCEEHIVSRIIGWEKSFSRRIQQDIKTFGNITQLHAHGVAFMNIYTEGKDQ